jgi:hypothetical protein
VIDFTAIPTLTDAQILNAMRLGVAQLAISAEVTIAGRTVRRADLPQLIDAMHVFEHRIALAGAGGQLAALVEVSQPDIGIDQHPRET